MLLRDNSRVSRSYRRRGGGRGKDGRLLLIVGVVIDVVVPHLDLVRRRGLRGHRGAWIRAHPKVEILHLRPDRSAAARCVAILVTTEKTSFGFTTWS